MRRLLILALAVAACGGGGTPAKTWSLSVDSMRYSTTAFVGGTMQVTATVTNSGSGASPGLQFQFNDLADNADIVRCDPQCGISDALGGIYATFPGVPAGASVDYEFEFIPTAIGAVRWSGCIYDDDSGGDQVYCGDATTTIR